MLIWLLIWGAVLELGFLWADGRLRARRWIPWAMIAGGLATMSVLVAFFDFPVSMIDLTHGIRTNVQPPSIVLLALAAWQCGAVLLFEDAGNRWLRRPRAWRGVIAANSMVMTFYLWNMSAVVLAAAILFPTGIAPQPEALSTAWWLTASRVVARVRDLHRAVHARLPLGGTAGAGAAVVAGWPARAGTRGAWDRGDRGWGAACWRRTPSRSRARNRCGSRLSAWPPRLRAGCCCGWIRSHRCGERDPVCQPADTEPLTDTRRFYDDERGALPQVVRP